MKKMLAHLAAVCSLAASITAQAADYPAKPHLHVYHHPILRHEHAYRHPHGRAYGHGKKHVHRRHKAAHPAPPPPLPALREAVPIAPAPVVVPRPVTESWQPYSYP